MAAPGFASAQKLAAEKQLLVALDRLSSKSAEAVASPFGRVLEVDKTSGMYLIELKPGQKANVVIDELKKEKGVRFVLPGSARFVDTTSYYSVDNHLQYLDDIDALNGKGDGLEGKAPRFGRIGDAEKSGHPKESKNDFYDALKYYLARHVDPNGEINRTAIFAGKAQAEAMPKGTVGGYPIPSVKRGENPPPQTKGAWSYIGPNNLNIPYQIYYGTPPLSGRITALAYDPAVTNTIYAGSGGGGLWKSTNAGVNWTCISDSYPWTVPAVSSIAIDPKNHDVIYVGTGDFDGFYPGFNQGIMKSADGGVTWANYGANTLGVGDDAISKILIDPDNSNLITICTGRGGYLGPYWGAGGIYQSANGGQTWNPVHILDNNFSSIDISAKDSTGIPTYWAAAGGYPAQIFYSRNRGATWTLVHPPTQDQETVEGLAASKVSASTVFVLSPDSQGLFKSTDYGQTWTSIQTGGFPETNQNDANWSQATYDYYISTWKNTNAPAGEVLFCGLITAALSVNDGDSWTDFGRTFDDTDQILHNDQHTVAFSPINSAQFLIGNDGGAFRMTVKAWSGGYPSLAVTSLNKTLGITQHYAVGPHPSNPNLVLSGAQDNASPSALQNFTNWDNLQAGDGGQCDWVLPQNVFYTTYDEGGCVLYDAKNFNYLADINPLLAPYVDFIAPTQTSQDSNNLYIAGLGLNGYNFTTGVWTYGQIAVSPNYYFATAIGTAPQDLLRIYTGAGDGTVAMTIDGGLTATSTNWAYISGTALPTAVVSSISVDPSKPISSENKLLVGFEGTGTGHLYLGSVVPAKTASGQATFAANWKNVSNGLPDSPLSAIVRDPAAPETTWFVSMDAGVFETQNAGLTWQNVTGNIPNVSIFDIKIGAGYLYAATFGRGIWRIQVK